MRPAVLTTRRAWPADAETLARTIVITNEAWRAFAPAGWSPPSFEWLAERTREGLSAPNAWGLLAFCDGEPAGHVVLTRAVWTGPAAATLWQLFVRPRWQGTGLADRLHAAFVDRARELGYGYAWLATPAPHVRARRFYERRGWRVDGFPEEERGLPMVAYGRALLP
jgi:GNAT superfamily N-acetyltransferase